MNSKFEIETGRFKNYETDWMTAKELLKLLCTLDRIKVNRVTYFVSKL